MSTPATEDPITRARELGLPVPQETLWYTKNGSLPFAVSVERAVLFPLNGEHGQCLFSSEKEAIAESRKHALRVRERWQQTINALDERYDAIEDQEIAQEKRRINDPD